MVVDDLQLYTAAEVADLLRLNPQVVQRKLQAGEIPGYRIGREWRVERAQLIQWLEEHSNQRDPARRFFDRAGRLTSLPAKKAVREQVLRMLTEGLAHGRTYTEAEMNDHLRQFDDDVAALRRELVMFKLVSRTPDGIYKLAA